MTRDEILHLIPFYVAGTLSAEERAAVEDGLRAWPDLEGEVQFWKKTSEATRLQAQFESEAHPSTEDLLAFADWSLADPAMRTQIANHVQACKICSEAYSLVKETEPALPPHRPSLWENALVFLRSLRLVYAIPITVVAVLLAVIIIPRLIQSPREAQLWLTYQPATRSSQKDSIPTLVLPAGVKRIDITMAIPHNRETNARYNLELGYDDQVKSVAPALSPFYRGYPYDSLRVSLSVSLLSERTKEHIIFITEDSTSIAVPPLPPLTIPFAVEREP